MHEPSLFLLKHLCSDKYIFLHEKTLQLLFFNKLFIQVKEIKFINL